MLLLSNTNTPPQANKYLITQTLLSSWQWGLSSESFFADFEKTLRREASPATKAQLDGQRYENVLNAVLDGESIPEDHEWYRPITEMSGILRGAQKQVKLSRDINIDGISLVLYGILDFLKAGTIYDCKFSGTYHVGKYLKSPQHPMYFDLVPESDVFKYLISDGKYVYTETYYREDAEPIAKRIERFLNWLDKAKMLDTYFEKWKSLY